MISLVFDIGGTKMRVARPKEKPVIVPTPPTKEEGVRTLVEIISSLSEGDKVDALVGGIAGVREDGVLVRSPNLPGWEGVNLQESLAPHAQKVEVRNDAELACLGEAVYGAGKNARIVAYLGIGTGVGGARVIDGVLDATHYNSEPGHQIIDVSSGKTLEEWVSGGALKRELGVPPSDMPPATYIERMPYLATGIANTILLWSPDILVLGGPLIDDAHGYPLSNIVGAVEERLTVFPKLPDIVQGELGDSAGLEGARALLGKVLK